MCSKFTCDINNVFTLMKKITMSWENALALMKFLVLNKLSNGTIIF